MNMLLWIVIGVLFIILVCLFFNWYFDLGRIHKQASREALYEMRNGILSDKEKESLELWAKEFERRINETFNKKGIK